MRIILACSLIIAFGTAAAPAARADDHHNCVTPAMAALVRAQSSANRALLHMSTPVVAIPGDAGTEGGTAGEGGAATEPMYRFHPMGGVNGADFMDGGYVDLDPTSPGFHDWACRPFTYDGHEGTDCSLRSFAEQFIGVPVFAARDGTVVYVNDGLPDTNVNGGYLGNLVVLDHGDGYESQYWHLRMNSITVSLGSVVKAGQQIGLVGSSGNSYGPHLHFQTMVNTPEGWKVHEPFAGACRPGPSDWLDQAPQDSEALYLCDFGITRTDLFTLPSPWWEPWALPTHPQIAVTDPQVVFWWFVWNFPQDALIGVKFVRPDGSIADDAHWNWGNTELWRSHKNWFAWDVQWLGPMVGTWHLVFTLDGQLMIDAPFEMVAAIDPNFNRPPAAIGASFLPAAPQAADVVFCRVSTQVAREDPDWDVVRYHYVWRVNGAVVRDVITAAQSDAIARNTAAPGAQLSCTVTPNDGKVDGPGASTSVIVAGGLVGDLNHDGAVNGADLGMLLGAWGQAGANVADLNGDGVVNGADLGLLLGGWSANH